MSTIKRLFVEKRPGFNIAARHLWNDLKNYLGFDQLKNVRIVIRYDIDGISDVDFQKARTSVFSEPPMDWVYDETLELKENECAFGIEYLPGQYDQRADSAAQCLQMIAHDSVPVIKASRVIILEGDISETILNDVKTYLINTVDSKEARLEKPESLTEESPQPPPVAQVEGLIGMTEEQVTDLRKDLGLAMSEADLLHIQQYFANEEKRDPSITEIRLLDTYWSDHCRHTTFLTHLKWIEAEGGKYGVPIQDALGDYLELREDVYGTDSSRVVTLMDVATLAGKDLIRRGVVTDVEISDEINACSIEVEATIDGKKEDWLVMFKNETHNHPTEIEPFGGAATCVGGCIRDPLSGRSFVYQAMRITGSADPRTKLSETLEGKLPQRRITTEAAHGYSSYGNQIGLATGLVNEIYHPNYVAKRMEIGAVIAGAPKANVRREKPSPGDLIVLVGGRTGRDGCGGATGSSKEHTDQSIETAGAEVQKGNAPTERKIQRLFRIPEAARLIKKCNDFGAGGVSVAIGELADGLVIELDKVPKKYDGLDGTELAISESQERMAVVLAPEDVETFIDYATQENLEAVTVATVTEEARVKMMWRGDAIVDISRDFIETNGVQQEAMVTLSEPASHENAFVQQAKAFDKKPMVEAWLENLDDLNVCAQKGLIEHFDATIGAGSVLQPFGGKFQMTPTQSMVAKLPVLQGNTTTGTIMAHGFNPDLSTWSPFHGALYAVVDSMAKVVVNGGDHRKIRLTLQEYFARVGREGVSWNEDWASWGQPLAALLGAFVAQQKFEIPAIGGKDSMSGTFGDISVPPTLVSFAVAPADVNEVISPEFKKSGSQLVYLPLLRDDQEMPDFDQVNQLYSQFSALVRQGKILSAYAINTGGLAAAVTKMAFGNRIGIQFDGTPDNKTLFGINFGSIVCEIEEGADAATFFKDLPYTSVGQTIDEPVIVLDQHRISLKDAQERWQAPLESVFPTKTEKVDTPVETLSFEGKTRVTPKVKTAKPQVLIPVFPGTNCEYDSARQFEQAGATADVFVLKNLTPQQIDDSLGELSKRIDQAQMILLPGGFSAGDEPEGSAKFIAAVFRNAAITDAVHRLLNERDGLMLGICNGFQALVKLGLLPYGEIRDIDEQAPTLTFNQIGRHVACMSETRISANHSPWLKNVNVGDIHAMSMSHGEGRFVAPDAMFETLIQNEQIAAQYVDVDGNPSLNVPGNPNGSMMAVEAITSVDGRILGKMGHSERIGDRVAINIERAKDQQLFAAGVQYFQG